MKILFFGTRKHGLETLQALLQSKHEVLAVTTQDYHMDEITHKDFEALTKPKKIPLFVGDDIEHEAGKARYAAFQADVGLVVGWRRLIREKILSAAKQGFLGIHGADLPKYRGFASTHYSILEGDGKTGFCIMRLKAGSADDGEIVRRFFIPHDETTTIADIMARSRPLIIENFLQALDDMEAGVAAFTKQDESKAVLSFPRIPEDGEIDWRRSAANIARLIRAVTKPYPGAFSFLGERKLVIWAAHVMESPPKWVGEAGHVVHFDDKVGVLTGDGILILDECELEDEQESSALETLSRSVRLRLGFNPSSAYRKLEKRIEALEAKLNEIYALTNDEE